MAEVFVGRQPIFDRRLKVVAYELLFRHDAVNSAASRGDEATSESLLTAFVDIGLDRLVGKKLAFINLTRTLVLCEHAASLPHDKVVLEILEDIPIDEQFVASISDLTSQGYRIALDDFIYRDELLPLIEMARIIKFDIRQYGREQLKAEVARMRSGGRLLLAEKVETQDELDYCMSLHFDMFQGNFLSAARTIKGARAPSSKVSLLALLAKLHKPDVSFTEIEEIISRDVNLGYKLLRCINSAYYGLPSRVESLRQALLILGTRSIASWAWMLALSSVIDKPHELTVTALLRAKMAERLAAAAGKRETEQHFTVGLFSVLDAMLDMEMADVLESLPLSDDLAEALTDQSSESDLSSALRCVKSYEQADWDSVEYESLTRAQIRTAYLEALDWSGETGELLAA